MLEIELRVGSHVMTRAQRDIVVMSDHDLAQKVHHLNQMIDYEMRGGRRGGVAVLMDRKNALLREQAKRGAGVPF